MPGSSVSSEGNSESVPYNPKNVLLQPDDANRLLNNFGVDLKIKNIDVYRKAFVHKSYCTRKNENFVNGNEACPRDCLPLQEESNERLEFLGDSILDVVVANYLYDRYPYENEGFLTKMRTKLVNGNMLAHLSKQIGLDKYILMSIQIEENEGRSNKNILEDTFESFIAAVFLDFNDKPIKGKGLSSISGLGFQVAECWIVNVFESLLDFAELIRSNQNYKDALIKFCQHTYQYLPKFLEIDVSTYNNHKTYTVGVKNERGVTVGVGKGETRRKAEQIASYNALVYYGQAEKIANELSAEISYFDKSADF
jgi:ribonuclease-3